MNYSEVEERVQIEVNGINVANEKSLHYDIKQWMCLPGDRFEVKVDNSVIDIVRDDTLIEIQTKNFGAIKSKLKKLVKTHKLILVYPIPREKWIVKLDAQSGEIINRKKSPQKKNIYDIFDELIRIPALINEEKFSIMVLFTREEELRCNDGKGSWRRKGLSVVDRRLLEVLDSRTFESRQDFRDFFLGEINEPFTNKQLSDSCGIAIRKAQKLTYCFRKMGILKEIGKKSNALIFDIANESDSI